SRRPKSNWQTKGSKAPFWGKVVSSETTMLTHRGWWFFLMVLALLTVGLAARSGTVTLIALTLLSWFLGQWLAFVVRAGRVRSLVSVRRQLLDEQGPVKTLWARLPVTVHVSLSCENIALPFVSVIDRVPILAERREGDCFA